MAAMLGIGPLIRPLGESREYDNKPDHVPRPDLLEQVLAEAKAKRERKAKKAKKG